MFGDDGKYGERVHCTQEQIEDGRRKAWKG